MGDVTNCESLLRVVKAVGGGVLASHESQRLVYCWLVFEEAGEMTPVCGAAEESPPQAAIFAWKAAKVYFRERATLGVRSAENVSRGVAALKAGLGCEWRREIRMGSKIGLGPAEPAGPAVEVFTVGGGRAEELISFNGDVCLPTGEPETNAYEIAGDHYTVTTTPLSCGETRVDYKQTTANGKPLSTAVAFDPPGDAAPGESGCKVKLGKQGDLTVRGCNPDPKIRENP